jgi:hypothetical protein
MSSGPHAFKLSEARRLWKAVMQVTGLPADRLRTRYSPAGEIIIEPVAGTNGKAEDGGSELDDWMKKHAGQTARD